MATNFAEMLEQARARGQVKAEAEKAQEAADQAKVETAAEAGRVNLRKDFEAGKELGTEVLGEGLGRLSEQEGVQDVRSLLQGQASGQDSKARQLSRESGIAQIQGSTQAASRNLQGSLARSGVKGGAAGQANVELAAQSLQQRRNLERDIYLADEQARAQGITNLATFETKTAEFDLAQAAKEKNILLQSQLATAELGSTERSSVRSGIAAERIADLQKKSGGKK